MNQNKSTAVNSTPIRHPKTAQRKKNQRFLGSKVAILRFPRTKGLLNQKFSVKRYRISVSEQFSGMYRMSPCRLAMISAHGAGLRERDQLKN